MKYKNAEMNNPHFTIYLVLHNKEHDLENYIKFPQLHFSVNKTFPHNNLIL